ncbi:MAG: DUF2974 domain-containing protein [Gammaproteobacteria bacterium]|nr:DUF2974 domain-containing protein [Gammaproteobacteria bacterium]
MSIGNLLDCETASETALYAAISSNAYLYPERVRFPIEETGWQKVNQKSEKIPPTQASYRNFLTGLALDIWEEEGTRKSIYSFRGTDSWWDNITANISIPISIQYKLANKKFREYRRNSGRDVSVTGHSLGGGLALSVSAKNNQVDAIVFNSSPRIFDGYDREKRDGYRVLISQRGEPLEEVRKRWNVTIDRLIPFSNRYVTEYRSDFRSHRADLIAIGLVKQGAEYDTHTRRLRDLTPVEFLDMVN